MTDERDELDFAIEFKSDVINDDMKADLFAEAERRLLQLAEGQNDMIGAAITIRQPASGQTGFLYEATVVVYSRPEHVAATEKQDNPTAALRQALSAIERQIRERRKKLRHHWERPGNDPVTQEVIQLAAAEELLDLDEIE
jgi:ribosome-associated translation inhibitor RaiA